MWWCFCFLDLISLILYWCFVLNQFHLELSDRRNSITIKNSRRYYCNRNCELFIVKYNYIIKIKALQFTSFQNDFVKIGMCFKSCYNFCFKHDLVLRWRRLSYFQKNHLIQRLMDLVRRTLDKSWGDDLVTME